MNVLRWFLAIVYLIIFLEMSITMTINYFAHPLATRSLDYPFLNDIAFIIPLYFGLTSFGLFLAKKWVFILHTIYTILWFLFLAKVLSDALAIYAFKFSSDLIFPIIAIVIPLSLEFAFYKFYKLWA